MTVAGLQNSGFSVTRPVEPWETVPTRRIQRRRQALLPVPLYLTLPSSLHRYATTQARHPHRRCGDRGGRSVTVLPHQGHNALSTFKNAISNAPIMELHDQEGSVEVPTYALGNL